MRVMYHKKRRQTLRLSHKSFEFTCLIFGSALVAGVSWGFAKLAEWGLDFNRSWSSNYPLASLVVMPLGFSFLAWFTKKYVPYVAGSGIPQVIASLSLPYSSPNKTKLVQLKETIWKIPLTFIAMCCGGSVGREGPSVQVGAAVMLSWGNWCRKHNIAFSGLSSNALMATGAAGGLAAAFNAPLAGVIFAIEELGRGINLRWEGKVLIGILACGFILIAISGNNPYFPRYQGSVEIPYIMLWVAGSGVVCGILGGIFARLLSKGVLWFFPSKWRNTVRPYYVLIAMFLGLLVALIGLATNGQSHGTGYDVVDNALQGNNIASNMGIWKLLATVGTYWTGMAGGIFTPCLTTGAGIGMQIWSLTGEMVDQRLIVLICMAGFLAGATQSPVTAAVVVMEMTTSQPALFWLLVCSLVSAITSRQFNPKPFYHFIAGRFRVLVRNLPVDTQRMQSTPKVER